MARGRRKQRRGARPRQPSPPPPPLPPLPRGPMARIQEWITVFLEAGGGLFLRWIAATWLRRLLRRAPGVVETETGPARGGMENDDEEGPDATHCPSASAEVIPDDDGIATGSAGQPGPGAVQGDLQGAQEAQPDNVAQPNNNNPAAAAGDRAAAAAPKKQRKTKGRGRCPRDQGFGLLELFRERDEGDDEDGLRYARFCSSRAAELRTKSKDWELCDICFFHRGQVKSMRKEELKNHCVREHSGAGFLCSQDGCFVRCKTIQEAGLHRIYLHEQRQRDWWRLLLDQHGLSHG